MIDDSFTQKARYVIRHAHWSALFFFTVFIISRFFIIPPFSYLCLAVIVGFLICASMAIIWRKRYKSGFWILWCLAYCGEKVSEHFSHGHITADTDLSQFLPFFTQWIAFAFLIPFSILALFRTAILRFCRLDEPEIA